MADEARHGRGAAQAFLGGAAVLLYLIVRAALPDATWHRVEPVAAIALGAVLLGLIVDAGRALTGVAPPLRSVHRHHAQTVERITDEAFDRADGAIQGFIERGVLTPEYVQLFGGVPDVARRDELLARAREHAGTRPRGVRPLPMALLAGSALVGAATLVALTVFPGRMAADAGLITLAAGVYALQVRGVTAGSRIAVGACGGVGALGMHAALAHALGAPVVPDGLRGFHVAVVIMLVITGGVVATMGARTSATLEEARERIAGDIVRLRRRVVPVMGGGLGALVLKTPVDHLLRLAGAHIGALLSAAVIAWWGYALFLLAELAGAHLALSGTDRVAAELRQARLLVHEALMRLALREAPRERRRRTTIPLARPMP